MKADLAPIVVERARKLGDEARKVQGAVVVTSWNPLRLDLRDARVVTEISSVRELAPVTAQPFICVLNGLPLLRADWGRAVLPGDVVCFHVLPQGGGGGGSNPIRVILGIILIVIGYIYPVTAAYTIPAGIGLLVGEIVMALTPRPKLPTPNDVGALNSSPTYSINFAGNSARLFEPITVQYGRMLVYPDYLSQPWVDYDNSTFDQYYHAAYMMGQGEYSIEQVRVEDTPIDTFSDLQYAIIAPGASIGESITGTDQNGNSLSVLTSIVTAPEVTGQDLNDYGTNTLNGSTIVGANTFTLSAGPVPKPGALMTLAGAGAETLTVLSVAGQVVTTTTTAANAHTTGGTVTWAAPAGPFTACGARDTLTDVYFDMACPRGLYIANLTTGALVAGGVNFDIEYRQIDDADAPLNAWTLLGSQSISAATTSAVRKSFHYTVPAGRYQFRLKRTSARSTVSNIVDDLLWIGLRSRIVVSGTPWTSTGTILLLKVRATGQLSGQSQRRVAVVATRKIPTWSPGGGWTGNVATRSVAWAFADAARNSIYSVGMPDSRLNLAALYALDQELVTRPDYCDGLFDTRSTLWESLQSIARAGRAAPVMQGGVLSVVRDKELTIPTALFSPRNMIKDSLAISYLTPTDDTPNLIQLEYWDGKAWAPRTVEAIVPETAGDKPIRVKLFGITDSVQAQREAAFIAANNRYRRRALHWETESDGLLVGYGDLVAVSHDLPAWGASGEVVSYDAASQTIKMSNAYDFADAGPFYIALSKPNGGFAGPYLCVQGAREGTVRVTEALSFAPRVALDDGEPTRYTVGKAQAWGQLCRVVSVTPRSMERVQIAAIAEDVRVHRADNPYLPITGLIVYYVTASARNIVLASMFNPTVPSTNYRVVIQSGLIIGSTSTGTYALDTGVWPAGSNLEVVVSEGAYVLGHGGVGGDGGSFGASGGVGQPGGPSMKLSWPTKITNNGVIGGGGAGADGGASAVRFSGGEEHDYPGGGGGAGAGDIHGVGGAAGAGDGGFGAPTAGHDGTLTAGGAAGHGAGPAADGWPGGGLGQAAHTGAAGVAIFKNGKALTFSGNPVYGLILP